MVVAGKFVELDCILEDVGDDGLNVEPLSDEDIELMKGAPFVEMSDEELNAMFRYMEGNT